jgi:cytochrome c peroxidase
MRTLRARSSAAAFLLSSTVILAAGPVSAQILPLSSLEIPRPANLADFVRDEQAARVLGKALFWDMQVGSDGVQACGTCHFRAGADPRRKNQISPGLLRVLLNDLDENGNPTPAPDHDFDGQGPNHVLSRQDFPLRRLTDPMNRESAILLDRNNVVSSQGVRHAIFGQDGRPETDPDGFSVGLGRRRGNVRRVEPRNTPTMINAVFNHRNFWDMRAQNLFNGVNPFGDRDAEAFLYSAVDPSSPQRVQVLLENSSLASQAVGPPTNRFEMSADGRTFPDVGRSLILEIGRRHRSDARRLLGARPLALQLVHRNDSVLGPYSRAPLRGLIVTYEALIRRAFQRKWWDSPRLIQVAEDGTTTVVSQRDGDPSTDEFTVMEYNFSLFFGLAVQAYEATLVADQTPFDRFLAGQGVLSPAAERGRQIFFNVNAVPAPRGNCLFCHSGPLLSEASVQSVVASGMTRVVSAAGPPPTQQLSDRGTRNIGVRPTGDDLGNGGPDPLGNSLSVAVRDFVPDPAGPVTGLAADGTFKIPGLRNVELTAPYFHNGGEATLLDVVNFYARGGNRGGPSVENQIVTRDGTVITGLTPLGFNADTPEANAAKADLVEFLKALTDERVRHAAAPFDHPQIFVPNGHPGNETSVIQLNGQAVDSLLEIPATGRNGGPVLPGFLEGD